MSKEISNGMKVNDSNVVKEEKEAKLPFWKILIYGSSNFGMQLSWTMVSTYLTVFYTDVFGIATSAVAVLMLVAKLLDGVFDPIIGMVMERTHTKWGRFRPYMLLGAPFLVLFTILTFTVPGFGSPVKLIYAYITYIGLSIAYSITNVPYMTLPAVMTKNPNDVNRLSVASMLGGAAGGLILNACTLPLVFYLGQGIKSAGYQRTAALYAILALPIFVFVFLNSKEVVEVPKEKIYQ